MIQAAILSDKWWLSTRARSRCGPITPIRQTEERATEKLVKVCFAFTNLWTLSCRIPVGVALPHPISPSHRATLCHADDLC